MSDQLLRALGVDSLPLHQRGKRVTDLMSLEAKVAVVTAGAGPILGRAIVDRLAGLGARLAVLDLNGAAAEDTAAEVADRWNVEAIGIGVDLTDPRQVGRAFNEVTQRLGDVDVLVNNLGLRFNDLMFSDRQVDNIRQEMDVTFLAPVLCTQAVAQRMRQRGTGRVINIASEGGKSYTNGLSIYNSMKSAVIGLTRNLSHEFAGTGVSFVSVLPGVMLTEAVIERMRALPDGTDYPIAQVISRVPAGRGCLPEEVANVVAFLATDAGSYVQATAVSVGGGMTSW